MALYTWWTQLPVPVKKAVQGFLVSFQFSVQNILGALALAYIEVCQTLHVEPTYSGLLDFIGKTWFATLLGLYAASYRAHQAYKRATPQ